MNETLNLVSALLEGFLFGAIFFAGLWWTVQEGPSSKRPALQFIGSLMLRITILVAGFYFASGGHWDRVLMCLFGFFIVRCIVMKLIRLPEEESNQLAKEANHAT
jgi:F1F0 ATPase subunit 2